MDGLDPQASGTVCAYHAAFPIVTRVFIAARRSRHRRTARLAYGPKLNLGCCGSDGGVGLRSSAIGRRCIRFAWTSLAKASGLATILLASWVRRSNKKAISATAI